MQKSFKAFRSRCGYCGQRGGAPLFPTTDIAGNTYALNRCRSCGAFYLSPRPAYEQLARAYDCSYYGSGEDKFTGPAERLLDIFRRRRARRLHCILGGEGSVLDVGCGNGRFLSFLGSLGEYRLHGIERDGGSAGRAMRILSINLKVGDLENGDFPDDSLDAVTLFHVFEHLEEPRTTIDTITRILRPGGVVVLSFPNIDSRQAALFRGRWLHLDPPRHLFFFPPSDFGKLVHERGFERISETHFHPDYNPFGFVQSILNSVTGRRETLYEYLKGNRKHGDGLSIASQIVLAASIAPVAVVMDVLDSLSGRGATVEMAFRKK